MHRKYSYWLLFITVVITLYSCKDSNKDATPIIPPQSNVTTVHIADVIDTVRISNDIILNAITSYLLRTDVKANTTGYITNMSIKPGDLVRRNQVLFVLQTKEARALGSTINQLDSSFHFHGSASVISPANGYVSMLNHQPGDFVQEGEILATISDASSFGFVADVPFEYMNIIRNQKTLPIELSDGRTISGEIFKIMPSADLTSQTVKVLIKVSPKEKIPENLIGNIRLSKNVAFGISVPKPAIVSDETQSSFWVMKLINDTTAVKIIIKKGIESEQWVQVLSDNLTPLDRIVTSGNFGVGDTILIKIEK